MNKKVLAISVGLLLIFGMAITLSGVKKYSVMFSNKSELTVTYFLYRVDHHIYSHPKPISFAVGTLAPGKKWLVKTEEGIYYIEFYSEKDNKLLSKTETFELRQNTQFEIGILPGGKKYEVKRTSIKGVEKFFRVSSTSSRVSG
jgi:hypothetical protein